MARKVLHEEDEPYFVDDDEFEAQGRDIAFCQCGLSDDRPFCDGSHRQCADEADGVVYEYDADGERHVVSED